MLTIAVGWIAAAPCAQVPAQFRELIGSPEATRFVAPGDFDGDGDLDLVAGGLAQLTLFDNDGTGALRPTTITPSGMTHAMAAGDMDGDGDLDVVCATANDVLLLRNHRGSFSVGTRAPGGVLATDCELVDVEGDGDLDVVFATLFTVVTFLNDGTGAVVAAPSGTLPSVSLIVDLAQRDVNGDGHPDLLLAGTASAHLFLGTGSGFVDRTPLVSGLPPLVGPELVDVDGDGVVDLVGVTNQNLNVFLGDGTGRYGPSSVRPATPTAVSRLSVGDLDGDGDVDLAGTDFGLSSTPLVTLLINDGTGVFADETGRRYGAVLGAGVTPIIGDFDGDRDLDVFVGSAQTWFAPADDRLLVNRAIDLRADAEVLPGTQLRIDVAREPGYGAGLYVGLLAIGVEWGPTPTAFGNVHLDPMARSLSPTPMTMFGEGTLFEPVPPDPGLAGLEFAVQGLAIDLLGRAPPRLTGFQRVRIR